MICIGVAKKTMRAEIASSVLFHQNSIMLLFVFHINHLGHSCSYATELQCMEVNPN